MPLNERKIRALANSDATYLLGLDYARQGMVQGLLKGPWENGEEYRATVLGAHAYQAFVQLVRDDESLARYDCTCEEFEDNPGLCSHLVALLTTVLQPGKTQGSVTDRLGQALLRSYTRQADDALRREVHAQRSSVQLISVLRFADASVYLRLKIGEKRMYYIKDMDAFYDAMLAHGTFDYGQQLAFTHFPENFTEGSRPLLDFVMESVSLRQQGPQEKTGAELRIARSRLDLLFDALGEGKLLLREAKGPERALTIRRENPRIGLHVLDEGVTGMQLAFSPLPYAPGKQHIYILGDSTVYAGDAECLYALEPLLSDLQAYPRHILFDRRDMPAFFQNVYPRIRDYVEPSGDTYLIDENAPVHPVYSLALDSPDQHTITGRLEFFYDGEIVSPYSEDNDVGRRDLREETRLRLLTEKQFLRVEEGQLVFEGDDDAIFSFLTEGLAALSALGDIFISDRLKRYAQNPAPPRVQASVSLDAGLLHLRVGISDFPLDELESVLESYRLRRKYYRLRDGQFLRLAGDALADIAEMSETLGLSTRELIAGEIELPRYRAMDVDALLHRQQTVAFDRSGAFRALVRSMKTAADSDFAVPPALKDILRNYQKAGYRWLHTLADAGFGGILADDMGLGKTLQILTLIYAARLEGPVRALIVCPSSLVLNWQAEIEKFCPALRTLAIRNGQQMQDIAGQDVLIISYAQLRRDAEAFAGDVFDFMVLDEAQMIKNAHTRSAQAVKAIAARNRFALTGTPIENRLSELWSIFDFLMPGYLFSYKDFREKFEQPIVRDGEEAALHRLQRMTAPFILRRLKKDVLRELPPKTETVRMAEFGEEQKKLYAAQSAQARREIAQAMEGGAQKGNTLQILAQLTRLRQICCDPRLFLENYRGDSAKLDLCLELLDEALSGGHKVLLFSQFTSMLDIIRARLRERGIASLTLQGSTPKEERQRLVERFQSGESAQVFLLSLKAGGLGLNLTAADIVILYDPWWNTAAENQAADRVYRIGQQRSVQVFRLIAKDTIEERILRLQERKQDLADSVIAEGNPLQYFTEADWDELINS